jgi:signal peptidase I
LPQVVRHENRYYGHALIGRLAAGREEAIPPEQYFVMGDNTFNSSDSRYWGTFHQSKVIGKSFFVYWPIGGTSYKGDTRDSRFGWAHR